MSLLTKPRTLIIAGFTALMALNPDSGEWQVVDEGNGKYFGIASLDNNRLGVVSRPTPDENDRLLVFDRATAAHTSTLGLPSTDTHQIARWGRVLYVADTGRGRLLALRTSDLSGSEVLFSVPVDAHLNTVRPATDHIDVLLHQFGPSTLVRLGVDGRSEVCRVDGVGRNSHDLVPWNDQMLVCASADGSVVAVDVAAAKVRTVWSEPDRFTKGLTVIDDHAWVGVSVPSTRAERPTLRCELVRIDLTTGRTVDRVPVVRSGLVNAVTSVCGLDRSTLEGAHA